MKSVPLYFRLRRAADRDVFVVCLEVDGRSAEADFAFDFQSRTVGRILEGIENDVCSLDDLRLVGAGLWDALLSGSVGELFESIRDPEQVDYQFRLTLPPELEALPWEALYHEREYGFLSCHPLHSVLRSPPAAIEPPAPPPPLAGKLRILAVVPAGSGLDVEREWRNLDLAVERVRERVDLQKLAGQVTPDLLAEKLRDGPWDVVHFIGHGEHSPKGRTTIRLNSEDPGEGEFWMDGEAFGHLFFGRGVRLAVLNCCYGAKASATRSLSGLGPFLLRAGVPAVVAMRYEIPDAAAIRFSEKLYQGLLHGRYPGRVDLAVESARGSIHRNQTEDAARPFVTPVLFLAGSAQLFEPEPGAPAVIAQAPRPVAVAPSRLPAKLLKAFRGGRCVPVIGQGVLSAGAVRSPNPTLGPRQLARELALRFSYPRKEDFEICETAGTWMAPLLLQWVCQYRMAQDNSEFFEVTEAIQDAYRATRPPDLLAQIAQWDVPGIFYMYFDGLLEAAFEETGKSLRVVNAVDDPVPPGQAPLLVHVRGTHRQAESLVLTEREHDQLWDRMAQMTPEIAELVRGHLGRSLLLLGVHPRGRLVKRLVSKLLDNVSPRTLGPVFFVCREGEPEEPYWAEFPVVRIEAELEDVVRALTEAGREECRG
ncbi:MAG: CHAT domain-containing protein [bacterium]|nr:CHAT domain-containing protein [bacterium]